MGLHIALLCQGNNSTGSTIIIWPSTSHSWSRLALNLGTFNY